MPIRSMGAVGAIGVLAMCALPDLCMPAPPATKYQLQANENLFVVGDEYRELSVTESADGLNILLNGIAFLAPRAKPPVAPVVDEGAQWANLKDVPFVATLVDRGMAPGDAIAAYLSKVKELQVIMADGVVAAKNDASKIAAWDLAVTNWIADPANDGIVEQIRKTTGGYEYLLWKEKGWNITNTSFISDEPPMPPPTVASIASQYIDFFQRSDAEQLLIVGQGGGTVFMTGKQGVAPALDQLLRVSVSGDYVPGPLTKRQLVVFGFIQGER